MNTIRILDVLSLRLFSHQRRNDFPEVGYRIVLLNMISITIVQEKSLKKAMAFHIGLMPLRLFVGFNISNSWVL